MRAPLCQRSGNGLRKLHGWTGLAKGREGSGLAGHNNDTASLL